MTVRVRFAPSPTGQVHIGNIRAAIFNWLYARHVGGQFLLRIEDTDLVRSTKEAIDTLLEVMDWLGLNFDENPPLYQTSQLPKHLAAAEQLLAQGDAYKDNKGGQGEAVLFRIPWETARVPGVTEVGPAEIALHPDTPLTISNRGVDFAILAGKGKAGPGGASLAGFHNLKAFDVQGTLLFDLDAHLNEVRGGQDFTVPGATRITFTRRTISYDDIVKGRMTKPLDSIKDVVIVRHDGSPVFHLANVVDDITQGVTHIIRGDDHVENTFKHIMLFACLGQTPPQYGHLPMIVNAQGKPYSKRDGDAFVGDFRTKGFLPEALFNYLSFLGWAPGDGREKMTREELVEAFTLERCQRGSAQMDMTKFINLNGLYMAEIPETEFRERARKWVAENYDWGRELDEALFTEVCLLMHSRAKTFGDLAQWKHFFVALPDYDEKVCAKQFKAPATDALKALPERLQNLPEWNAASIEAALLDVSAAYGVASGKLNQPARAAVTGTGIGAGIFETMQLLGRERCVQRLQEAAKRFPA
ncbi:MAG: glutamate--tRNA ligase [Victivallales bacterium]|nr:glutamate--tRNA ligase [Victivallales bacterium]